MMAEKTTGGCLCGAIRYEADEPPNQVYACHCRMCQRHTGSAFWAGAKFPPDTFRFTKGEPKVYRSSKILERLLLRRLRQQRRAQTTSNAPGPKKSPASRRRSAASTTRRASHQSSTSASKASTPGSTSTRPSPNTALTKTPNCRLRFAVAVED